MRLLIYLLAMLTGFSAAEAARPVSAVPASVGAEVGRAYVAAAVKVAEKAKIQPARGATISVVPSIKHPVGSAFFTILSTTPVLRHDVILG